MLIAITNACHIQEKQLKKVRAKQKRLQAILGGEDIQRVEAELLAEDDDEDGEEVTACYSQTLTVNIFMVILTVDPYIKLNDNYCLYLFKWNLCSFVVTIYRQKSKIDITFDFVLNK